ncbi:chorismate mutase [Micromonospora hortensis]|uniref:chorismate mutase n=1 Tax=Micromonospora hortensis TaxID=2911209 RepID=UPI001EE79B9F|nr:chorismate mutase [Micromonospora hortensis]MCG5449467.1 chorismate mutase [Micromonospora hortensis]
MAETAATLTEIRARIDELDRELVGLLARREALVRQAAPLKSDAQAVRAPDRVAQVVARVRTVASEAGADPDLIEQIYRAMIQAFIDMETDEHHRVTGGSAPTTR